MNAIQLLKDDHKKVRGLLAELVATTARGTKKRSQLLAKIAEELRVHVAIEEEIFYPAFKAAGEKSDDDQMYFEALEEHRAAGELVLPDLEKTEAGGEKFRRLLRAHERARDHQIEVDAELDQPVDDFAHARDAFVSQRPFRVIRPFVVALECDRMTN